MFLSQSAEHYSPILHGVKLIQGSNYGQFPAKVASNCSKGWNTPTFRPNMGFQTAIQPERESRK
ncbi:MAG: hypothetical protein ACI9DH_000829 [Halioglobus sp.]|jgi:hypothetical protein